MSQTGQTNLNPSQATVQVGFHMPAFYANGFSNTASLTDVTTVCLWNNRPQASLTMPLSLAKSYALNLLELVKLVEDGTGQKIAAMHDLERANEQSSSGGRP